MNKKYKVSLTIYSFILIAAILFMFALFGASGHRYNFSLKDVLITFFVLLSILSLIIYPRVSSYRRKLKVAIWLLSLGFLGVSLFFAIQNIILIFSGNLIIGFIIFSSLITVIFCIVIISLALELIKNMTSANNRKKDQNAL
ncbi:hypothetical protein [Adhaeribacter rhizoryzae]|uniref:DUF4293 family protein n=1 Tax=Adhaeribacter rhizoryzae TaxID=2607907 RepID=A0A5M6D248_9BACT|nr:hypothetical protein [Adhaeribacter rhizoryzae]KAA5541587.1 hypothetical protein F0145_20445 [Adhaeribacter rhizoryzae]